jgi:hypothetical protein
MSKRNRGRVSCNDCYFRASGLCALPGDDPCPTFRAATGRELMPPPQPTLVMRQLQPQLQPAFAGNAAA